MASELNSIAVLKQMTASSPEGEALTEVAAPMRAHKVLSP